MAFKRLVVLSDGTWQTLENPTPTNIQLLTLSIAPEDDDGVQQIIIYDEGVGTDEDNPFDKFLGGALGKGIDQNIQQLYTFLALNYEEGDEIYLFGFSRGAYTVRSLNGMIHKAGLTRRSQVNWAKEAYELYRKKTDPNSDEAVTFRKEHGDRVPVKLLACFDTVGSLGLPFTGPLFNRKRYEFHDTELCSTTENAIHMLSIDEDRKSFEPTLMTESSELPGQLSQLYFWGGHGGIGGGDSRQTEPSKATLTYVLEEMERRGLGLKINSEGLPTDYNGDVEVPKIEGGLDALIRNLTGRKVREIETVDQLHETAIERFLSKPDWRPDALKKISPELVARQESRELELGAETLVAPDVPPAHREAPEAAEEEAAVEEAAEEPVEETAEEEAAVEEAAQEEVVEEEAAEEEAVEEEEAAEEEAPAEEAAEEEAPEEEAAEEEAPEEEAAEEEAPEEEIAGEEAPTKEAAA